MRLKNKVAVITGAASGIGKEIALTFAREGASIVVADLNGEAANAVANELSELEAVSGDSTALGVAMNVSDEEQVEAGIEKVMARYGRLDILVSNAGIQTVSPIDELPFSKWKQLLAVHLDGAFLTTRAALRHMYRLGERRQHYLYGIRSLERGIPAEGTLRDGETRVDRAG
jgi:3-hydroxybutyrate dehydrogenase